jgi:asparagine synthase (glutamine-hydrolysing)
MGMRRLSIVDQDTGSQPIYNEDETVAVVFNGEIYNHRELRRELTAAGHSFSTECDTEVLVHAWEEYGTEMPIHLNGMFAFAIVDENDGSIFLSRDRLGIKPLYYSFSDGELFWSSEIQPLLRAGISPEIDQQAIFNYFNLRYFAWPQTPFEQIRKVPPGTSFHYQNGSLSTERFWTLDPATHSGDLESSADQFKALFENSVRKRLMADVPLGAFLSGGLDSSAIVGIMSEELDREFKTFAVGFQNAAYDESEEAAFVADHFGTDHHEITVDLESMDLFGDLVAQYGEPLADPAALPTLALSHYASEHIKVVLTGEGADELFGGYWYNDRVPYHQRAFQFVPDPLFKIPEKLERVSPVRKQTLRYVSALRNNDTSIRGVIQQFDMPVERYLDTDDNCTLDALYEMIADTHDNVTEDDFVKRMTAFDINHYLVDDLLYKTDQSSMAASLEARVPFLDHNIVEFAYNLPTSFRQNGYKPVVNRAMSDILPERIRERSKHGFSVPVSEWLRKEHYAVTKWLDHDCLAATPYVNADRIHTLWNEHRRKADHSRILWKVLTYVAWYHRIVLEQKAASAG